ncbi:MAG: TRAP transporter TatT component family protein [Pyrinomonadaceae bacterium]
MANQTNTRAKWCFRAILIVFALMVFGVEACHKSSSRNDVAIDSGDASTAAQKVAEAELQYGARDDLSRARAAVALLRQARTADYGNYEAVWKLARDSYYVGEHTTDEIEQDQMFRQGIEAGKAAVELQSDKPEGHFWLGANYGGSAAHSTLAGLANVEDIKREMEAVIKIDEEFQGGSAYMALGRLYLQAPRMLGGDKQKAIEYLEKGLRFGPNNALLHLYLAQAYEASDRDSEARKQADYILTMKPDPQYTPEYKDAVEGAKKLQNLLRSKEVR